MKNLNDFIAYINESTIKKNGEFIDDDHRLIWELAYLPSQEKKSEEFNLRKDEKINAFNTLINRGRIINELFSFFNCNNFCEVGTAEGYQHFIIANTIDKKGINGKSYTCDVRDVRNDILSNKYKNNCHFVLGTSKELSGKIFDENQKIDLFWIDGDHRNSEVLKDVLRLAKVQSKNCIWAFDDYNSRFGSYNELQFLGSLEKSIILNMGITSSGQPNSILIIQGEI